MKISGVFLFASSLFLLLHAATSCQKSLPPPVIAISKASDNYINWLKRADSTVQYVNLYPLPVDSALKILNSCNGLLLTGGEDVFPGIYGDAGDTARCGKINYFRDTLEINLVLRALELKMPIFGVCRGEQLLNVIFGGELFVDIPKDFNSTTLHQCDDYLTCFHTVHVEPYSLLHTLCNCDSAVVTTNHHQAVKTMAPDLKASAYGPDGLIEGIELTKREGQPFLLAVQWHPERMEEGNPLSGALAVSFLMKCRVYRPQ